jgi:hypothetical protein
MRIGRANNHGIGLPFHTEIIAEAPLAREQTKVFLANQGLSDRTHLDLPPACVAPGLLFLT